MSLKLQPTSVIKANLGLTESGVVQKYFQNTCYRYMDKYVPYDEGHLREKVDLSNPKYIIYNMPYAHYIYTGILYVDPVTNSSWARKDVKKIPTGKTLKYHTTGTGHHWDKLMMTAEGKDVVREVQEFFNRGGK